MSLECRHITVQSATSVTREFESHTILSQNNVVCLPATELATPDDNEIIDYDSDESTLFPLAVSVEATELATPDDNEIIDYVSDESTLFPFAVSVEATELATPDDNEIIDYMLVINRLCSLLNSAGQ